MLRTRINAVLTTAVKSPLVVVCASAGSGKTQAVSDFASGQSPALWLQLSELDNTGSHFWKSFTTAVKQVNEPFANKLKDLGFPDTADKQNHVMSLLLKNVTNNTRLIVFDDVHLVTEPAVLEFLKQIIHKLPSGVTVILICRDFPKIDIDSFRLRRHVPVISEKELNFTENELVRYATEQKINVERHCVSDVIDDTGGWVFAVNLIVRSLQNSKGYSGYVRNSMKKNIFELMEKEVWQVISEELQHFLLCLSLIEHLSADLIFNLAGGNEKLIGEFKEQNAYIRYDSFTDAYLIHSFFWDFIRTKHHLITKDEKTQTYKTAADWCNQNDFTADTLTYYEKIGDYESIVSVLLKLPQNLPYDIAKHSKGIFERAPAEVFDSVKYFCAFHLATLIPLGKSDEFFELSQAYEQKMLALPQTSPVRNSTLCGIYYSLAIVHAVQNVFEKGEEYNFYDYFSKINDYMTDDFLELFLATDYPQGAWINLSCSSEKGAPQKYIEAVMLAEKYAAVHTSGVTVGADELIQGELLFYQGDVSGAEPFIVRAINNAKKRNAHETRHRALFYMMRIAVAEGNYSKFEEVLREIETLLKEKKYQLRFTDYDVALGWYNYILRRSEMFPEWLKEDFCYCKIASVNEFANLGNILKARYRYITRDYQSLLIHINKIKQQPFVLYGRIEMLALEACVHYKMKDVPAALESLQNAYDESLPNGITMPFIELGKDMRTLIMTSLRENTARIPQSWLESIRSKSASYAKNQSKLIANHKLCKSAVNKTLSAREHDILSDLYYGLSQSEIAVKHSLSVNTVKMVTKSIYEKLHVHKISDLIRVAAEQRLV
jgi:LuxR family maltose regulon positive regulatory protein